jgi:hypothetical protein
MVPFKQKHSDVSDTTLEKDRYAVLSAEPAVKRQLSDSGFSDAQMDDALIASWRALRSQRKAVEAIEAIDIVKESAKQGLLVVDSVPEGAAVIINVQVIRSYSWAGTESPNLAVARGRCLSHYPAERWLRSGQR